MTMGQTGGAAVDGTIVAAPIDVAIREGINPVPLMVGTCINEGTMLTASVDEVDIPGHDQIIAAIGTTIGGGDVAGYTAFLDTMTAGKDQRERMSRFWYDYFRAPTMRAAEAAAEVGMPAFVYSFEVPTDHPFGPTHASDMAFTFNLFADESFAEGQMIGFHPNTAENRRIAAIWSDAVARFMRSGDPSGGTLGEWPHYTVPQRSSLVLRSDPMVVTDYDGDAARRAYGIAPAAAVVDA
jgi:carboxylesterase type B